MVNFVNQRPQNCREVGPGKGRCDMCSAGHYDRCRYLAKSDTELSKPLSDMFTDDFENMFTNIR